MVLCVEEPFKPWFKLLVLEYAASFKKKKAKAKGLLPVC